MRLAFVALLLLLCQCPYAVPEVGQAAYHNLALAPSLLGAKNACGAPVRAASEDDLFIVADARIVSLVPQAGNTTSDLANASLLWSWSADFPAEARFPVRYDPRCPAGEIRYFAPSPPSLAGSLLYRYGNATDSLALLSSGPNPAPLNLSAGRLIEADFSSPFVNLSASIVANLSLTYQFSKSYYSYGCTSMNGYEACGCEMHSSSGTRTFTRGTAHARNFSVEAGPVAALWLNPPLSSRLEGEGEGKVAFFARRMPANISFSFAGVQLGSASPYSFSIGTGECGEKIAVREFSPSGAIFLNASAPIFPSQLVEKDASYVPFYAEFPWHAPDGKGEFAIIFEDAFSRRETFARNFSVRQPKQFFASDNAQGAMEQRQASEGDTAAAYPSPQKTAAYPDFSLLAAAFALPLAIGAAALARRLEWL